MGHLCQCNTDGCEVRKMGKLPCFFMQIDGEPSHKAVTDLMKAHEGFLYDFCLCLFCTLFHKNTMSYGLKAKH